MKDNGISDKIKGNDNKSLQAEGKLDKAKGRLQETAGKLKDGK
jgi:uncharacterized protein YjbJ (UPF0337 family)